MLFPKKIKAVLAILFIIQGGLTAFTFAPISQDFSAEGKNSSRLFTITNDSLTERIAVKVSVFTRIMDEWGNETLEPAPGDFLIYPAQSLLNPGDSRSVRIKWKGGTVGSREKAYRIIAEQLPVDFTEEDLRDDGAGIRFTFRYEGSLYVLPPGARPDVKLLSISSVSDEDGMSGTQLVFENQGTRHAILGDLTINLESRDESLPPVKLDPSDLAGVAGENILAGNRRYFTIPQSLEGRESDLQWSFNYKPVY